jgi:hypothetical protein
MNEEDIVTDWLLGFQDKEVQEKGDKKPYDPATDWVKRFSQSSDCSEIEDRMAKKDDKAYWYFLYRDPKRKFPFLLTDLSGKARVVYIDRDTYDKLKGVQRENDRKKIVLTYLYPSYK